ncbi:SPOR domain-containing protein [Mucilaginibacter sp. 21P]|uniref:HU domain-containing protein n=1 Tax=Mucilaginibacter sp. 21P TaxID=2778902 RepID=UPI001C587365|nr:SPOR domain-containing protein [Mucilaginibacter sp. 21P]QXV67213.1 SPOR domain-containing protein [Mucilaginibacter sp. 21P]
MDVGNYISELLAQKGEVSVPGLGYFAHTRVNGYYNEADGKFYPPTYSVQFDPQIIDDDSLAQHIADKKKISVASAKYFTEKYINGLKLQAQTEEAALADLGWFYIEQGRLFFSANNEQGTDPNFFGYEPVALNRIGSAPKHENVFAPTATPVETAAPFAYTEPETFAVAPEGYPDNAEELQYQSDEEYEAQMSREERSRKRRGNWIFIISILLFFALAVFLVYRFNPNVFNFASVKTAVKSKTKDTVINAKVVAVSPEDTTSESSADTMKRAVQPDIETGLPKKADSTVVNKEEPAENNATETKESTTGPRYEIMGGSFKDDKEANTAIANYKRLGIEAHIVSDAPGKRKKVSLGTYKTRKEAEEVRKSMIANKKVNKDIYTLEIKPKL